MKQWLVVAELPEPLRTELAQLRAELDIWNARWLPPHVTIVRPFAVNLSASAMAEITRPVTMTAQLLRWSTFRQPENNVLFLEPTQGPFQRLREDLLMKIPEIMKADRSVDPNRQFAEKSLFHVTIAAGVPDGEIDRILSKVSQKTYMHVFQVHNLSLYSLENGGFWQPEA